ncbi:hypothetical protein PCCS19_38450 [Paenibacillus sp. CCS19]|uniref:hypothetical protein n=1 Tax=Paenibacillus sp. CCS19 TaxID=3158387 RepID=UPI00256969BE|nr:hypothetical protein [Paenibacillus cellulosilyticus]GMK40789.1 hypothetical protein PCCS19_38450 [Paenibacillus cellulosilyticus]
MEKLVWSIAFPGFGQFLNGKYLKGILFIALEILINTQANLNEVIILSFHGETQEAIESADYGWMMFYPCLYLFSIWDAYRDSGNRMVPFSYIPFVMAAYFFTIGLIFSPTFEIAGFRLGPVWLSILFCFIGIGIGLLFQKWLLYRKCKGNEA